MRHTSVVWVILSAALFAVPAMAQHAGHTPYAGQQSREIKGLSPDDIAELRAGRGWGLALPAELNGRPGPAHVLELAEDLQLTPEQHTAVTAIFRAMQAEAIAAGERLIAAEAALSDAFAGGAMDEGELSVLLVASEAARSDLRFIHLSAHLATPGLLTPAQIQKYNVLRGYAADPCDAVPEGHDATMWRRHNGCN